MTAEQPVIEVGDTIEAFLAAGRDNASRATGRAYRQLAVEATLRYGTAFSSERRNTRSNVDYFVEPIEVRLGWFPTA